MKTKRNRRKINRRKINRRKTLSHRRKGGAVLGKFYLLNEDEHGFRPLYLTLENVDSSSILAWSCPPEKYPNPHYFIRGMQQDILPISILKEEIDITKMTKRGGNIILTDGYYKIKFSKDWINDHNDLWESIVSNYDL